MPNWKLRKLGRYPSSSAFLMLWDFSPSRFFYKKLQKKLEQGVWPVTLGISRIHVCVGGCYPSGLLECDRQRTFARAGRMAESERKEGELEIRWCDRDKPRYAKMASLSVFGVGRQQFGRTRITIIPGRVIRHIGNGQLPLCKQVARIHGAGQAIEKSGRIFRLRT